MKIFEKILKTDRWLWVAILLLALLGIIWIASATASGPPKDFFSREYAKQLLWVIIGGVIAIVLLVIDYSILGRWAWVIYWGSIVLLILVLIPGIGDIRFGARRWIDLGPIQFQPSEFAKLAVIILLSHYLSRPIYELKDIKVIFKTIALVLLPAGLIILEPDLSTSLVMFPVFMVMLIVARVPTKYILQLIGLGVAGIGLIVMHILWLPENLKFLPIETYQERRILVYFGKVKIPPGATEEEKQKIIQSYRDAEYNIKQALISIGSGGLWGKGWGKGRQNVLGYLPRAVAHNDFIFSIIAEESGFVGSIITIGLLGIVVLRALFIANEARDSLGKLIATGIASLWFVHTFINIGMNIKLLPVTGLPLPLLSYGGSAVVMFLASIGILQSVYVHRTEK